jgi:tripartite-type tricarboxylate transporter receptor subunit TctC
MKVIKKLILSSILCLSISNSHAFDPTSKPITVVIPFAPGGGVDATFRHFEKWSSEKGLKFAVLYKSGAEGLIGMNEIAGMPKDGYHIAFGTAATIAVQRIKNPSAEVEPITAIKNSISAIITHKDSGIKSIKDLYKGDKPKTLAFGAPGQKMLVEQIVNLSKEKINPIYVPYKGGAPVVQDIAGNHVQIAAPPLLITKPHIDSGTIHLLAVGSKSRLAEYPTVPAISEIFPDWKDYDGFAVILPKGVNQEAVKFWNNILKEYMNDKKVQEDFVKEFNEINQFGKAELEKLVNNATRALSR